jgi:hypothetical protein
MRCHVAIQIDPNSTYSLTVPCICRAEDGSWQHSSDTVSVRDQYGYGDLIDIQTKAIKHVAVEVKGEQQIVAVMDPGKEHFALLEVAVRNWTFTNPDGAPLPVGVPQFRRLPEEVGNLIALKASELYEASKKGQNLPNP